jgi:hypothetical protein
MEEIIASKLYSMKFTMRIIVALIGLFMLASCEKEVDVNLSSSDKKVVVEGFIETDVQPYVSLTYSIGFFDKIDLNSLEYVKNAIVTIDDLTSGKSLALKEYNVDTTIGNRTFTFSIYAPDYTDPVAMSFKGQVGHLYKLQIQTAGKTYTGYTQIPASVGLDSVRLEPVKGKENEFSTLRANYTDPDTFGNCVRLETLTNRYVKDGSPELFFTSFNAVYDDNIINGTMVPLTIDLGYDKNKTYTREEFENLGYVRKGDTVTIKWSAIDKSVYTFYQTLTFSAGSVGNPFASPTKIQGNVSGALGVWAGLGTQLYTIIDSL